MPRRGRSTTTGDLMEGSGGARGGVLGHVSTRVRRRRGRAGRAIGAHSLNGGGRPHGRGRRRHRASGHARVRTGRGHSHPSWWLRRRWMLLLLMLYLAIRGIGGRTGGFGRTERRLLLGLATVERWRDGRRDLHPHPP